MGEGALRADDPLRAGEAHVRAVLDASLDCVITIDGGGRVVEFNPAAERTFGRTRDEVLGRELAELIVPPSLREAHRAGLARCLEGCEATLLGRRLELTGMRSDGTEFPVELTIARIDVPDALLFTGTLRDISDRKRLEEELETRIRELQRERDLSDVIADTVASLICVVDGDGRVVQNGVNKPFRDVMGHRGEDVVGQPFWELAVPPGERATAREAVERVVGGDPTPELETSWLTRNGEERLVRWTCIPVVDRRGRELYLVSGLDLTEHRRSETELERFFELSTDLLCTGDADGNFTRVNPTFERVLGFTAEELLGTPAIDIVHPEEREWTLGEIAVSAEGPLARHVTNRCGRRDGSYRWIQWGAITDPASGVFYAVGRDVTEERQAQEELRRLAHEQAALRRVATLVATAGNEVDIFARVAEEVGRLLEARTCSMARFGEGETATIVAGWGVDGVPMFPVGSTLSLDAGTALGRLRRSGEPTRIDDYGRVAGAIASDLRASGIHSSIAAPITVSGRLWGATIAAKGKGEPFPEGAERRLGDFADLVAQALANADARADLADSRARLVETADAERRRLERNLHDGAQQRLVTLALSIRLAVAQLERDPAAARARLEDIGRELAEALEELRVLAQGIHPAILTDRGLAPALQTLAARAPIPVEVSTALDGRLPEAVETAAYYVVSEALANVAKYAEASAVIVSVVRTDGVAVVEIADDGVGGASTADGSGLRGLADRVETLDGRLEVWSEPGAGTRVRALLPCD